MDGGSKDGHASTSLTTLTAYSPTSTHSLRTAPCSHIHPPIAHADGDVYDVMGGSRQNVGDYSAAYKHAMTWIPSGSILSLPSSGAPSMLPASSLLYAFRASDGSQPSVAFYLSPVDKGSPIAANAVLSFRVAAPNSPEFMYATVRSLQHIARGLISLHECPMKALLATLAQLVTRGYSILLRPPTLQMMDL